MFDHAGRARCVLENDLMSLTEFVSRPFPVFAKLAFVLRNIPAVQFVLARCAALLRADRAIGEPFARRLPVEDSASPPEAIEQPVVALPLSGDIAVAEPEPEPGDIGAALPPVDDVIAEPLARKLPEAAPGIAPDTVEQPVAVVEPCDDIALVAEPEPDQASEREKLIRRRWAETGSKMWNPDFHGAGWAALNIQGRVELLPAKPGEQMPRYDKLEFRLVGADIVCEGVVVDPPRRRK
jgi:hypothetical protein